MNKERIEKIKSGIEKYCYLRQQLYAVNVAEDADFQRVFNNFFRMARRSKQHYIDFYQYLEAHKRTGISYADALAFFYEKHGKLEMSFISKMVAIADPAFPIWDSVVAGGHFGMKAPYAYAQNRYEKAVEKYAEYCRVYATYMRTDEANEKIKIFDRYFPNADISDVKKLDFILWQDR